MCTFRRRHFFEQSLTKKRGVRAPIGGQKVDMKTIQSFRDESFTPFVKGCFAAWLSVQKSFYCSIPLHAQAAIERRAEIVVHHRSTIETGPITCNFVLSAYTQHKDVRLQAKIC